MISQKCGYVHDEISKSKTFYFINCPQGRKETQMSQARRKCRKKRRINSKRMKHFNFVDCPAGGAIVVRTKKGNYLHVFDNIGFMATDIYGRSFEIEGLIFDQEKGWFDANAVAPKFYSKNVYSACIDYATDIAITENLHLGIALFGKERPAKCAFVLGQGRIAS